MKRTFEEAKLNIESKHPYLTLLEYNGSKSVAKFLDLDHGEFEGIYRRVEMKRKMHPKRSKNRAKTFEEAKEILEKKIKHLTLLEYSGSEENAKFLDHEYGEFIGVYYYVLTDRKSHPKRSGRNHFNFDEAKAHIESKYTHLTLLEYNKSSGESKFLDNECGEFFGKYYMVEAGRKVHPDKRSHKKLTFDEAKIYIENKYSHLTLLEFTNGCSLAKFNDHDYGEFEGIFSKVDYGNKVHPDRRIRKPKSFEEAKNVIENKFNYITLLEYNGSTKISKFNDIEYGEFEAMYCLVLNDLKKHPTRGKINRAENSKKTCLERYGSENPFQVEQFKYKSKETCLEKYGTEYYAQTEEKKEKSKETCLERYGHEYATQSKEIREKTEQTNLERYGSIHTFTSEEIRDKIETTTFKNHGYTNVFRSPEFRERINNLFLEKYNSKCSLTDPEVKQKRLETWIKNYGEDHPFKNQAIKDKVYLSNINNGNYYNVNGKSLQKAYKESGLDICFATFDLKYKEIGIGALDKENYVNKTRSSKIGNKWLDELEEELRYNLIKEFRIPETRYHADGYDPETNTVYEFHGDMWHGNLDRLDGEDGNPFSKTPYKELNYRTYKKQLKIEELGYNYISIWESDFRKNMK